MIETYREALAELERATEAYNYASQDYSDAANERVNAAMARLDAIIRECKEKGIKVW